MRKSILQWCSSLVLGFNILVGVQAQGTINLQAFTVTATRNLTKLNQVPNSLTVISEQEIKDSGLTYVSDVIRRVPGVDVLRSGGSGKLTSVFMRGSNSEHTLVMIDGVEVNDPVSAGNVFNFANLSLSNVERIEVLRGAQSTLYGSDAIGGVIHIITKKGSVDRFKGHIELEGGSFSTFNQSIGLSGGSDIFTFSGALSHQDTDGFSSAEEDDGNSEDDGYENTTFSLNFNLKASESLDFTFNGRFTDSSSDIDNGGGAGNDDPNHVSDGEEILLKGSARLKTWEDRWVNLFSVAHSENTRDVIDGVDNLNPFNSSESTFDSERLKLTWQSDLSIDESHTLIFGFESEEEVGSNTFSSMSLFGPFVSRFDEKESTTDSIFAMSQWRPSELTNLNAGVRYDDHSDFGSDTNYQVGISHILDNIQTKIKATFATGFKAPTLFQLFSQYGNLNLEAEETKSFDIGLEKSFADNKGYFIVTFFNNDLENLIDFDFSTFSYKNVGKATTKGIEFFLSYQVSENLLVSFNYTYTEAEDEETGLQLVRRPENKGSFFIDYNPTEKWGVDVTVHFIGERPFNDFSTFPAGLTELDSYTLVNLATHYQVNERVSLFGRIDNLTDDDYQEVLGFGTAGISAYAGVNYKFFL